MLHAKSNKMTEYGSKPISGCGGVEPIIKAYTSGKPLFSRTILEKLDKQLAEGGDTVYIEDLNGKSLAYSVKVPTSCSTSMNTYSITYNSYQSLTNIHPEVSLHGQMKSSPVQINYTRHDRSSDFTVGELKANFESYRAEWEKSKAFEVLKQNLSTVAKSTTISRIVAFGLGSLERGMCSSDRSLTQHAAIRTMAEVLEQKTGRKVACFVQDPVYNDVEKEVLRIIGITTIDDPKGFLETNHQTLVVSISPNVPVRQIIADVQWPAAMIWNTVDPDSDDSGVWKKQMIDGSEIWVTPYSTDPSSARVRTMVKEYDKFSFPKEDENFGTLTMYVRKRDRLHADRLHG